MIIRPFSTQDLSEITRHIQHSLNQSDIEYLGFIPDSTHINKSSFQDPDYNKDYFLGAFDNEKCIGSIMGVHRPWKEGRETTGYIKWILIDPKYRNKGLGSILYTDLENKFKNSNLKILTFGSSAPAYFLPGLPKDNKPSKEFFINKGWKTGDDRVSLLVELKKEIFNLDNLSIKPKYSSTYTLSSASNDNKDELIQFVSNEFSSSWSNEVKMAMEGSNPNSGSIILQNENMHIIGFAAFNGSNPQWFGPMGVKSDLRKEGFGRILFYEALKEMMRRGIKKTILPWINGKEEFYPQFFKEYKWKKYYKLNKEL